ncbi:Craniofacial development protein 2, partial [Zootermopsis nevadensis]
NVRTMLRPGKMNEIENEIVKYKLDVVALQEIRWQGRGQIDKQEYALFYSPVVFNLGRTGLYGTGFIVKRIMRKSILEFEAVNERICKLRVRGKFRSISIISAYAPTEDKAEEGKEEFYDLLEQTSWKIQKYDIRRERRRRNAKIERQDIFKQTIGNESLHALSNDNGVRAANFAKSKHLIVNSQKCLQHDIHKYTWTSLYGSTHNQIESDLADNRRQTNIIYMRSFRAADCDTDHYPVVAKVW